MKPFASFITACFLLTVSSVVTARAQSQVPQKLSLRESVDTALEHNLDLKVVRSGERIAGHRLFVERARFDPALTAVTGYSSRLSPSNGSALEGAPQAENINRIATVGLEKPLPTGATVGLRSDVYDAQRTNSAFAAINPTFNTAASINVRQPLLKNAGFTYNLAPIRLAELDLDSSSLESQIELLGLLRETEFSYWLVVATGSARDIRRNSIDLGNLILEEAVEREKANLTTRVEVLEAKAALAEKEEALLSSDKLHKDAADRLFKAMGVLQSQEPGNLILEDLPYSSFFQPDPRESFDRALKHAPIHLVQLNALRAREIERRSAKQDTLPQLDLVASSGLLGRDANERNAYSRLAEANGYFWEVNLELRLPWGRRAEKARYAEAVSLLERERLTTDQVKLQLYADIRIACREVNLARERLAATKVTEDLNIEKFEQRQSEQRTGQTTMRDLLEAQEDMEEAQLRHLEAAVQLLDAIARLAELEGTLPRRYGLLLPGNQPPSSN